MSSEDRVAFLVKNYGSVEAALLATDQELKRQNADYKRLQTLCRDLTRENTELLNSLQEARTWKGRLNEQIQQLELAIEVMKTFTADGAPT
jgi:chromosome segregation ATPase